MRVLTVDTATRRGMVAAVQDDEVLASAQHDRPMTHAERLFGMIDEVLEGSGWSASQIELIAVGKGPGSFTGVRVGMAAAKGFGFAKGIPMVGVVSLEAMALAARRTASGLPVAAMLDAKKGEVFLACYDAGGAVVAPPAHIPREEVSAWLDELPVQRDVLRVVGEVTGELGLDQERIRGDACDLPGPAATAWLARNAWTIAAVDEIDVLEPLYVRPPDITLPAKRTTWNSTARGGSA